MSIAHHYWTFLRLEPAGNYRACDRPEALAFLETTSEPIGDLDLASDETIQSHLFEQMGHTLNDPETLAQLCLRCFISQQIVQACLFLVNQFGTNHQFQNSDLLPLVLEDDGCIPMGNYPSIARQTLDTFQATSGSLHNWVIRLVRQHREVHQFLLERGLCLISDWAILNDTPIDRLQRILTDFYHLSPSEIQPTCALLETYRAVYLADRLQQRRQTPTRPRQCPAPTLEQLQRMSDRLYPHTNNRTETNAILTQLSNLAKRLRQYRIAIRSGQLLTQSMAIPKIQATVESKALPTEEPEDLATQNEFLQQYRQIFLQSLDRALEQVIQDRVNKAKNPEKADRFLKALNLFYRKRLSMTEIAAEIGVQRQDNVTYLLKLKDLRTDVRNLMLRQLQKAVLEKATEYLDPDRLQGLSQKLDDALTEQVEHLIQAEEKRTKTPKDLMQENLFAQRLTRYLDRLLDG